jgi:hypothetical protein
MAMASAVARVGEVIASAAGVLSPLWISGILLAAALCALFVLLVWGAGGRVRDRR